MPDRPEITVLLKDWSAGNAVARDRLMPLVYDELQRIARRAMAGEHAGHTLQPTALVHEVFARLIDADIDWQDRAHFYALCARMMRRLLVNHAASVRAAKRGGDALRVTLEGLPEAATGSDEDLLVIDEALNRLAEFDARKADLIELQYFAGLSFREMSAVTGLSSSTLDRELRLARAWLKDTLLANS